MEYYGIQSLKRRGYESRYSLQNDYGDQQENIEAYPLKGATNSPETGAPQHPCVTFSSTSSIMAFVGLKR